MLTKTPLAPLDTDITYEFVNNFLNTSFDDITELGAIYKGTKIRAGWIEIMDCLTLARARAGKMAPSEKAAAAALAQWKRIHKSQAECATLASIDYRGPNETLAKFVQATTGKVDPLDLLILKHFVWQVKRKIAGLEVTYHLMPVLVGRTGKGKSVAISKFLAPVKTLAETGKDFSIFSDSREWHLFGEKYVFLFDEMSKARKVDVESLKNTITCEFKSYRPLYSNSTIKVAQNGTFLGASNDPISSLINDPTSARRFWQLHFTDSPDRDLLNSLDLTEVWQSVDETEECPVLARWEDIMEVQHKQLRAKSNPEEWFEEQTILNKDLVSRASDLYEKFREWEDIHDPKAKTSSRMFYLRLAGIDGVRKDKLETGTFYNVELRKDDAPKGQVYAIGR